MITISAKIEGMDTLLAGLKAMPEKTVEFASTAVKKSVVAVQSSAIKEAPVNKQAMGGNLRQSIRSSLITKLKGAVISNAKYSIFVHEGTAPHEIRPVTKKALANIRTGQFFGKLVKHPGTRPNPYMQRAYDQNRSRIDGYFREVLDKVAALLMK